MVKVYGESEHGMYGAQIEVNVNENLFMESFKKPLVAKHTQGFIGISFLFALFGLLASTRSWKQRKQYETNKPHSNL